MTEASPINFNGLITSISKFSLEYKLLVFSNFRLAEYLRKDFSKDRISNAFRLINESTGNVEVIVNGLDLIKDIEGFADHFKYPYDNICWGIIMNLGKQIREKYITNVYEVIKNYSDHNKSKGVIDRLQNEDWFRILHLLRRNASHFDNYAKPLGFPDSYPDLVVWKGFCISKGQLGENVKYNDAFVIDLLDHCFVFLNENRASFE